RRAARTRWRNPPRRPRPRPERRSSPSKVWNASRQRFQHVREALGPGAEILRLLALPLHDLGRCARDELFVRQPRLGRAELAFDALELGREPRPLLIQIDEALEREEEIRATLEDRARAQ